jgi:hypothetical protein
MKIIIRIISIFIFSLLFSGCSVIYTTAVDQRNVNTIINDTKIKFTIANKFYDDEAINSQSFQWMLQRPLHRQKVLKVFEV